MQYLISKIEESRFQQQNPLIINRSGKQGFKTQKR